MTDHTRPARRPGRRGPEVRCRNVPTSPGSPEFSQSVAAADVRAPSPADPLTVEIARVRGDTAVVVVTGEIDLRTADTLRARLVEIHGEGPRRIVADFAGVPFCDAAGLGALVAAHNRVSVSGGEIALARVRPAQSRLLSITGLDRLFAVHADVTGALADHDPSTTSR